jgi:glycerol-3-phosphate dehydrogenase (NAD(P)+)
MNIGVIGAGAWGTALANLLAGKGFDVALWAFESEVCEDILKTRENKLFLPGFRLSENIKPSTIWTMLPRTNNCCFLWCHPMFSEP